MLSIFHYFRIINFEFIIRMMEEELLEVNKKISQIEGILQRRRERASEWNLPYKKVIEEKLDKTFYLDRSSSTGKFLKIHKTDSKGEIKAEIQNKVQQSRLKIHNHYNELKELDILNKHRNKIRAVIKDRREQERKQLHEKQLQKNASKVEKQNEKLDNHTQYFSRSLKERTNPFTNAKGDKFTELYHQLKKGQDNLAPKLMKHFGVGIQNTPLGSTLKKKQRKISEKAKNQRVHNKKIKNCNFVEGFTAIFNKNAKIFGRNKSPNLFEDRIKKIIKYHGDFWKEDLQLD